MAGPIQGRIREGRGAVVSRIMRSAGECRDLSFDSHRARLHGQPICRVGQLQCARESPDGLADASIALQESGIARATERERVCVFFCRAREALQESQRL